MTWLFFFGWLFVIAGYLAILGGNKEEEDGSS